MALIPIERTQEWARKRLDGILFNKIIAITDGIFLIVVMNSAINIYKARERKVEINVSYVFSIIALVFCFCMLASIVVFIIRNYANLSDQKKKKRCGYIYSGLNYKKKGQGKALFYPLVYQLRFVLLVYTILYLHDYMIIQFALI